MMVSKGPRGGVGLRVGKKSHTATRPLNHGSADLRSVIFKHNLISVIEGAGQGGFTGTCGFYPPLPLGWSTTLRGRGDHPSTYFDFFCSDSRSFILNEQPGLKEFQAPAICENCKEPQSLLDLAMVNL
jgi:hypothetical protein